MQLFLKSKKKNLIFGTYSWYKYISNPQTSHLKIHPKPRTHRFYDASQSQRSARSFKFPFVFRNPVVLVTQGACQKIKSLNISVEGFFSPLFPRPAARATDWGRQLDAQVLFTAVRGRKQADVNEGWRFHEAQLVDGRFNVTGLNWAMIRTVCKIHFLAGLCPPAPSSERSSPSPSSYAFECNKNWTMLRCARFHLTTITFRKERGVGGFFFITS